MQAEAQHNDLLNARQMAYFARDGFLKLDEIVPRELNEAVHRDEQRFPFTGLEFWNASHSVRKVFALPQVAGAIESLVGKNATYDHSYLHSSKPHNTYAQFWHIDSGIMNPNRHVFDIQAFYFAHDTPVEMGPTLVLPGSHLRFVDYFNIARYKNIVGQRHMVAKAGTIYFSHQDIWHCGQPNHTDTMRYVFKIRLNPVVGQRGLFHTEGYDDPEIVRILNTPYPWYGSNDQKEESIKKKFWDHLVGI